MRALEAVLALLSLLPTSASFVQKPYSGDRHLRQLSSICFAAADGISTQLESEVNIQSPKMARLTSALGLDPEEVKKMSNSMGEARFQRLDTVNARHLGLFFRDEMSMSEEQVRRMIVKRPGILSYRRENVKKTAHFFVHEVGLSTEEFASMMEVSRGNALTHSVDRRLRPVLDFFRDEIGCSKFKWIARRYPQIFSHGVDEVLRPRAQFLHDRLDLKRRSDVSQIASKFPPIFWLSEENLLSKIDFLRTAMALKEDEMRDLLVTYPQILGLSLEGNLIPTVAFLLDEDGAGLTREQLNYFVLYQPALVAYSLANRIRPRIERMSACGISLSYSPPGIMSYTNSQFDEWLEMQTTSWSISN